MKEIVINDFSKYVTKRQLDESGWQAIPYTADGNNGVMLFADQNVRSQIEIDCKVKGLYKVYLCLGCMTGDSQLELSLSGEEGKTIFFPSHLEQFNGYARWHSYEYAEEAFFRIVDLSQNNLVIGHPYGCKMWNNVVLENTNCTTTLLYVRLVPISERERQEYEQKHSGHVIQYHLDQDFLAELNYKTAGDYLGRFKVMDNGYNDTVIYEVNYDNCQRAISAEPNYEKLFFAYRPHYKKYLSMRDETVQKLADYEHARGVNVFGGHRMGLCDFWGATAPTDQNYYWENKYPQYLCQLRSGKNANFLSYAYPQARKSEIDRIVENTPDCFDGVSLFYHRGVTVLFEKPVCDKVNELYGVDAHRLPFADSRLNSVLCSFNTQFLRELKQALQVKADKCNHAPYKINAVVYYDLESSKNMGYDVETWAREGLVDSISQGLMTYYEDLDGCLASDGLIDVAKYTEKARHEPVVKRTYDDRFVSILPGVKGFVELSKKYGIDYYASLPWEHGPYQSQLEMAQKLYELGAEKFLSWNANHIAKRLPVINAVKEIGDKQSVLNNTVDVFRKVIRLTMINGVDISEFDPNWKG